MPPGSGAPGRRCRNQRRPTEDEGAADSRGFGLVRVCVVVQATSVRLGRTRPCGPRPSPGAGSLVNLTSVVLDVRTDPEVLELAKLLAQLLSSVRLELELEPSLAIPLDAQAFHPLGLE